MVMVFLEQVVAGWGHTALISVTGRLYMCGRNVQGQLGLGDISAFPRNERGHPYQVTVFCVYSVRPGCNDYKPCPRCFWFSVLFGRFIDMYVIVDNALRQLLH